MGALLIGAISIVSLKINPMTGRDHRTRLYYDLLHRGTLHLEYFARCRLAVIMTTILIAKQSMHGIASQWITESELRDGIFLLALLLIALPLVPNKPFGVQF